MDKKKGALIVALLVATIIPSFFVGAYMATGNLNPWGNRHYYEVLNANVGACVQSTSGTSYCETAHNVIFNGGALWAQQLIEDGSGYAGCTSSATCAMKYIALSGSAVSFAAADSNTGATNGNCAAYQGGSELNSNGMSRAAGTVTDISGSSPQTSTIVHVFTDSTSSTTVQDSCLINTGTISSANNVIFAAASFTSITLQPGDTIQITWSLTYTWS